MIMPKEGEGHFICKNCNKRIVFPTPEGERVKVGLFGLLQFPKCPECGSRKFKRDMRWQS